MVLNYIILGLIFAAGLFLVILSAVNARFLFSKELEDEKMVQEFNRRKKIPFIKRSRNAYLVIGIAIIIMGILALLTGFLEQKIEFE